MKTSWWPIFFFGFTQLYHNNLPFYKVSSIFKYFCWQGTSYLKLQDAICRYLRLGCNYVCISRSPACCLFYSYLFSNAYSHLASIYVSNWCAIPSDWSFICRKQSELLFFIYLYYSIPVVILSSGILIKSLLLIGGLPDPLHPHHYIQMSCKTV